MGWNGIKQLKCDYGKKPTVKPNNKSTLRKASTAQQEGCSDSIMAGWEFDGHNELRSCLQGTSRLAYIFE